MRKPLILAVCSFLFLHAAVFAQNTEKGKVLLLLNERVLEGDIEKVGGNYRIRRGVAETMVAVEQCQHLFPDWQAAYEHQASKMNLTEPDQRVRLARWCHQYQLREKALENARAALTLRPNRSDIKQLVRFLEHSLSPSNATPTVVPPNPLPTSVTTSAAPMLANLDLDAESMVLFTTRVQPILMNTCVGCHANGKGGSFQLTGVGEGINRAGTQHNLAAVFAFTDFHQPRNSMVLVKAISAHGPHPNPPLPNRQSVPFQTFSDWLVETLASNPHLRKTFAKAIPNSNVAPAVALEPAGSVFGNAKESKGPSNFGTDVAVPAEVLPKNEKPAPNAATPPSPQPQQAEVRGATVENRPTANSQDPYDPATFNQAAKK